MLRYFLFIIVIMAAGCQDKKETPVVVLKQETTDTSFEKYFPVTTFIKGQIRDVADKGINPIRYITIKNITDSSWVKVEDMEKEVLPFLDPVIDTSNMKSLYKENKFLDQTINAFTFTYDPIEPLNDSISLRRWDVYVDPDKQIVTRIYMIKNTPDKKIQQLTWQSDKWAKMVTMAEINGQVVVEKEILIKWDY